MEAEPARGSRRIIDGRERIYLDGYWIKTYQAPADSLRAKRQLIEALTRRLFNHVEHGLNVPGSRLETARLAYESETDPRRKRVKAGMLAGALFNRAADVFKKLVELQEHGVIVDSDNSLMKQCGEHLQEALVLGKQVLHRSGEEGIDELWGEPFKAFAYPIEDFYKSRYVKIAMTMGWIDRIADAMVATFGDLRGFCGIDTLIGEYARAARCKCETLRTEPDIFEIWTSFVVSGEAVSDFSPHMSAQMSSTEQHWVAEGMKLLRDGRQLIEYITRARVPMPKSGREYIERLQFYRNQCIAYLAEERVA
ncbi:MAG: hypothetical protein QM784_33570 [Polyangiaceae bacterium]